jgi:hypothetical protein
VSQPASDERAVLIRTIRAQLAVLSELDTPSLLAGRSLPVLRRVVQALAVLCTAVSNPDEETRATPR